MTESFSQEEIDKMLRESQEEEASGDKMTKSQSELMKEEKSKISDLGRGGNSDLTQSEIDILGEIANISLGSASTSLSENLSRPVVINTPTVNLADDHEVESIQKPYIAIHVNYIKGLDVENLLVIERDVAISIASLMMGGEGEVTEDSELDDMSLSAVQEAMNQMMGASATSMSQVFGKTVDISPPRLKLIEKDEDLQEFERVENSGRLVKIAFQLVVEGLIDSHIYQIISLENAKSMAEEASMSLGGVSSDEASESSYAINEMNDVEEDSQVDASEEEANSPSYLVGVEVKVEAIFGNTRKRLKDLLVMEAGHLINLEENVNDSLLIYANGVLVAKGEIVNIDGYFGIQVVEIV